MSSMTTVRRAFAAATKSDVFLGTSFSGAGLRATGQKQLASSWSMFSSVGSTQRTNAPSCKGSGIRRQQQASAVEEIVEEVWGMRQVAHNWEVV